MSPRKIILSLFAVMLCWCAASAFETPNIEQMLGTSNNIAVVGNGRVAALVSAKKVTPLEIRLFDLPPLFVLGAAPSGESAETLARADALLHVVRAFERDDVVSTCNLKTDETGDVRPGAKAVDANAAVAIPVHDREGRIRGVVGIAFMGEREIDAEEMARLRQRAELLPV